MTAQERSRWLEQLAIQEAALDLTLEKGYRGFTMDELAQRTGMPCRTLFQRVGDKMSAVMGVKDDPRPVESVTPDPALPPFDAVPFPLDDLFPFDDPAAPALPET